MRTISTCGRIVLVLGGLAVSCGPAPHTPAPCPVGRTWLDGVCVSEAVADYVACVRAQGAQLDARAGKQLSAEVGYLGVKASAASEVSESLQRRYSASDTAMMAIIDRCGRAVAHGAPSPASSAPLPQTPSPQTPSPPARGAARGVLDTWKLEAMFETSTNPSTTWSLGYRTELVGALTIFPVREVSEGNPIWWDPRNREWGVPSIWRRATGEPRWGISMGQVAMHPGCTHSENVVARFTAPVSGVYELGVRVGPGDLGKVDLAVVVDTRVVKRDQDVSGAFSHETGPLDLRAGSTLDFVVGVGSDRCFNDNVPVDLAVKRLGP